MKKMLSIFLVTLFTLCCFSGVMLLSGCQDKPSELHIMTYNIRTMSGSIFADPVTWEQRKGALFSQIHAASPDVISFQEVTIISAGDDSWGQLYDLIDNMPGYAHVGRMREDTYFAEGVYIFYKTSRLTLLSSGHFWLSETPEESTIAWDAGNIRITIYAKFRDNNTGKEFYQFATHLDHQSNLARKNGLDLILERMPDDGLPKILSGDFNFDEEDALYPYLNEHMDDSKLVAVDTMDTYTSHNFGKPHPERVIDYIFLSKDSFSVAKYMVHDEKYNDIYTSDHRSVSTFVTIK